MRWECTGSVASLEGRRRDRRELVRKSLRSGRKEDYQDLIMSDVPRDHGVSRTPTNECTGYRERTGAISVELCNGSRYKLRVVLQS